MALYCAGIEGVQQIWKMESLVETRSIKTQIDVSTCPPGTCAQVAQSMHSTRTVLITHRSRIHQEILHD